MDVSSVNKPAVQPAPVPKRPAERPHAPVPESKPPEDQARKAAQAAPKPVVNTQGQLTGRHVNVSA